MRLSTFATLSACVTMGMLILGSACSSKSGDSAGGTADSGAAPPTFQTPGDLPDAPPPVACVAKEAEAVTGVRPVDIIFAIDNSDSMSEEIGEVEQQINVNFASIIEASKVDYRVVMLSNHGSHSPSSSIQQICVQSPLSSTSCKPIPPTPAEKPPRFFHHNIIINSLDALCQILTTYNLPDRDGNHPQGWAALLRPNAFKVFAIITDDHVAVGPCGGSLVRFDDKVDDPISAMNTANAFETALFALNPPHFGSAVRRNYIWHSIVGVTPFDSNDKTKPYPPSAPLTSKQCNPGAVAPGLGYQALSQITGGLRYPTCGLDYTTIFKAMAKDVIDNAVLPCDYPLPANPSGGTIDPDTAVIRYTSGTTVTDFERVANEAACGPKKFFIENERIKLCGDACITIQSDPNAQVKILFGCLPKATK